MGGVSSDWLAQLAPAHAPAALGWWPLAPGWWGLAALLAGICVASLLFRRNPHRRTRHAALRELTRLARTSDDAALARGLENLMRRYAIVRFGRERIAGLNGEAWIGFVATHGGVQLAGNTGANLLRSAYGGHAVIERAQWLDGARAFMRSKS